MASGGHPVGHRPPPPAVRPKRNVGPPGHLEDYVTWAPKGVVAPPPDRSLGNPAPTVPSYNVDQAIADNLMRLTDPDHPAIAEPTVYAGQLYRQGQKYKPLSRTGSCGSLNSSTSGRGEHSAMMELLKAQLAAQQAERKEQTKFMAQLAAQQAARDRQTMTLLTQVMQNQSARSSARSSRRASCRESRQHSPEHQDARGQEDEDHESTNEEGPGEMATLLTSRLVELAEEEQAQGTDPLPDVPNHLVGDRYVPRAAALAHLDRLLPPHSQGGTESQPVPLLQPQVKQASPAHARHDIWTPPSRRSPSPPHRQLNPYVEEITFPNFTKEDRAQYLELRLCLEILLTDAHKENHKYAILLKHVKAPCAHSMVLAHAHSAQPYTAALADLDDRYGRPWDFILHELNEIEKLPPVKDDRALDSLSVRVQSLVGMLRAQQERGLHELHSGSNVERILAKIPKFRQERFRHFRRSLPPSQPDLSLIDLSNFLREEVRCLGLDPTFKGSHDQKDGGKRSKDPGRATTVMLQADDSQSVPSKQRQMRGTAPPKGKPKPRCPYCEEEHWLHGCESFKKMGLQDKKEWIKTNHRCWRCARDTHKAADCNLKKKCDECGATHLRALHEVNLRDKDGTAASKTQTAAEPATDSAISSTAYNYYIDPANSGSAKVMLKIVRVHLHYRNRMLDTYAVLDDGSERTLLLASAANQLGLQGQEETLSLRTIRRGLKIINGERVTFQITPAHQPDKRYTIKSVFTSKAIGLAQYDYPVQQLQERFAHLKNLPLPPISGATPTLLIGSDNADLITPISVIYRGPRGCPAAIETRLGWTLQGPIPSQVNGPAQTSCFYSKMITSNDALLSHVERLWQLDLMPFKNEKLLVRSKEDKYAISLLEQKTTRVEIDGVQRYATPLLRREDMPRLHTPGNVVHNYLRNTEKRLSKDPRQATIYQEEMKKLVTAGYVQKISDAEAEQTQESWYLPHHKVTHNGKERVVFNCSFQVGKQSLNRHLLPGPPLGPSLLGVLLRFRQDRVAVSGDIKGMFHQVRLLEEDQPLLRFLWREDPREERPSVYQWQVLPFGTTCSPCCATFALQKHVAEDPEAGEDARNSVARCFYVDNCLQSVATVEEATQIVHQLRKLLARGGFDLRQWASSDPQVLQQLPAEAKAESSETWMTQSLGEGQEMTLGLVWRFKTDTLHYRFTPPEPKPITRRSIYSTLASQYDPLGYILPYTTRAKVLVREMWAKDQGWDDPLPEQLAEKWREWEKELPLLCNVTLPRSYLPSFVELKTCHLDLHVFSDASETAYGAVAYLRATDPAGEIYVAFVLGRSRVAPRKQQSIPRLELCAALVGAQLAKLTREELTLPLRSTVMWSDSTTVITWLKSSSCRYKVFVGTRVTEIQELVGADSWRYVDTGRNSADVITRGDTLAWA